MIQRACSAAAEAIKQKDARIAALEEELRGLVESVTSYGEPRCAGTIMLYCPQIGEEHIKHLRILLAGKRDPEALAGPEHASGCASQRLLFIAKRGDSPMGECDCHIAEKPNE